MTKEREALKLALAALEESCTYADGLEFWDRKTQAIAKCKEALAQTSDSVKQESVACDCRLKADECNGHTATFHPFQVGASCSTHPCERVYTTPPQRLALTDAAFLRAIEAKLKELNHD